MLTFGDGYQAVDRECHSCSSATWLADRQLKANTWTLDSWRSVLTESGKRIPWNLTLGYLAVDRECHSCSSATWLADRKLKANTWTADARFWPTVGRENSESWPSVMLQPTDSWNSIPDSQSSATWQSDRQLEENILTAVARLPGMLTGRCKENSTCQANRYLESDRQL